MLMPVKQRSSPIIIELNNQMINQFMKKMKEYQDEDWNKLKKKLKKNTEQMIWRSR